MVCTNQNPIGPKKFSGWVPLRFPASLLLQGKTNPPTSGSWAREPLRGELQSRVSTDCCRCMSKHRVGERMIVVKASADSGMVMFGWITGKKQFRKSSGRGQRYLRIESLTAGGGGGGGGRRCAGVLCSTANFAKHWWHTNLTTVGPGRHLKDNKLEGRPPL